ncbi:MAG: electron transport complex subunit RsxD [Cocleimonas sp.]|nr:electron transport complex subunit RsxD [Cocleimonas sp.]
MKFKTDTSPFFGSNSNVSRVMLQVILALIPGTLMMFYIYGWGILINVVVAIVFAVALETLALIIRKRPILPFLYDLSAIVTAWLLALSLPPLMPWWILLIGIFFAIIIAKHLYGGLGYNPFNPAMIGFAVLIVSFPFEMSQWIQNGQLGSTLPSLIESLNMVFSSVATPDWDAITMATPLDEVKTGLRAGTAYAEIAQQKQFSLTSWIYISVAFAIGGAWLLYKKIIHWQIPASMIGTLAIFSGIMYLYSPETFASPLLHIFGGATVLGAFFIATDPVSASTTPTGKLIYGASIGFFIYVIRVWGNYPDAIAFAVLIMNMAVPLIDYYTQPRVYGHRSSTLPSKKIEGKKS